MSLRSVDRKSYLELDGDREATNHLPSFTVNALTISLQLSSRRFSILRECWLLAILTVYYYGPRGPEFDSNGG